MKKIIGLVTSLTIIAGVCAAVLAYVNKITAEPIKETAKANEMTAVKAVMPAGVTVVEPLQVPSVSKPETRNQKPETIFVGKDADGKVIGYAAKGKDGGGYGGDIVLMVGFEKDKKTLVCYKTLAAAETPGLGMKLNSPEFADQFKGKEGTASLKVKKDGGAIEAITSATITSRAVCRAIADAQGKLQ